MNPVSFWLLGSLGSRRDRVILSDCVGHTPVAGGVSCSWHQPSMWRWRSPCGRQQRHWIIKSIEWSVKTKLLWRALWSVSHLDLLFQHNHWKAPTQQGTYCLHDRRSQKRYTNLKVHFKFLLEPEKYSVLGADKEIKPSDTDILATKRTSFCTDHSTVAMKRCVTGYFTV